MPKTEGKSTAQTKSPAGRRLRVYYHSARKQSGLKRGTALGLSDGLTLPSLLGMLLELELLDLLIKDFLPKQVLSTSER